MQLLVACLLCYLVQASWVGWGAAWVQALAPCGACRLRCVRVRCGDSTFHPSPSHVLLMSYPLMGCALAWSCVHACMVHTHTHTLGLAGTLAGGAERTPGAYDECASCVATPVTRVGRAHGVRGGQVQCVLGTLGVGPSTKPCCLPPPQVSLGEIPGDWAGVHCLSLTLPYP